MPIGMTSPFTERYRTRVAWATHKLGLPSPASAIAAFPLIFSSADEPGRRDQVMDCAAEAGTRAGDHLKPDNGFAGQPAA